MTDAVKKLSVDEQCKFLAEVNAAISKLPGSDVEKAAKFLAVNKAAYKGASKGTLQTMVAETFATVPVEHLSILAESFSQDIFNRASDPKVSYTDDQFAEIAVDMVKKVAEHTAAVDNCEVRSAMAAVMMVMASNGTSENLINKVVEALPEDARSPAKEVWLPTALGLDGRTKSFDPMLAAADAGRRPDFEMILIVDNPQHLDALLADIVGKNVDDLGGIETRTPVTDAVISPFRYQVPTLGMDVSAESVTHQRGADVDKGTGESPLKPTPPQPEPGPYGWQSTNN